MKKLATTEYPILDQLRERWSPRAFSDRPITIESIKSLLESARWAASCFNEQPWRFIVAPDTQPVRFETALSCLNEWNRSWASSAPLILFVFSKECFEDGKTNVHAVYDTGQAMANMTIQATTLGLSVHQMAGVLPDKICASYDVPLGFIPICAAAIGYQGDIERLNEDLREKEMTPRTRRPLSELVYAEKWDKKAF